MKVPTKKEVAYKVLQDLRDHITGFVNPKDYIKWSNKISFIEAYIEQLEKGGSK